jgi:DNA processing protein
MLTEEAAYNALAITNSYRSLLNLRLRHRSWVDCLSTSTKDPEKEWKRLEDAGVRLVLRDSSEYPSLLKRIPHPPHALYIKGHLLEPGLPVAVVGTRRASSKGKAAAKIISKDLTEKRCAIISGLALGIDAAAHSSTISAGGYTVAVLAHGLSMIYPNEHIKLANKILDQGGALVSEYPLGTTPRSYRFLERNRIVSGLSKGVLAIEAPVRSGVLATARFAMEQDRFLWVLPGPYDHPNFEGSLTLVRSGATLIRGATDILEDLANY